MNNPGVTEGMAVYRSTGERLGEVVLFGSERFIVERRRSWLSRHDHRTLGFDQVREVDRDGVHLLPRGA